MSISGTGQIVALDEATRNALLRKIDWRFLLEDPHPRRVVSYGAPDLAAALRQVAEEVTDGRREPLPEGSVDLAVASDAGPETLSTMHASLAPGGYLYVEWRRESLRVKQARSWVEAIGFEDVTVLLPEPRSTPDRPRQWVPVESKAAHAYALRSDTAPHGWLRRWRRRVRDAVRLAWPAESWFPPFSILARKPQFRRTKVGVHSAERSVRLLDGEATVAGDSLEGRIRQAYSGPGTPDLPERIWTSLLTGGRHSENKVIALIFPEGEQSPLLAVKLARVSASVPGLTREAEVLREIGRRSPAIAGVPKIIFEALDAPAPMVGQTVVTGRPVHEILDQNTARRISRLATEWQIRLVESALLEERRRPVSGIIDPILADFDRNFREILDPGMFRAAADAVCSVSDLIRVPEHRDFSPWNVLLTDDGVAVLDWESSVIDGLPALDLIYFSTYVSVYLEDAFARDEYEAAYRRMLDRRSLIGEITREVFDHYSKVAGVSEDDLRRLRILCWMIHSRSDHRHFVADGGGVLPPPERLRESTFLRFWNTEMLAGEGA